MTSMQSRRLSSARSAAASSPAASSRLRPGADQRRGRFSSGGLDRHRHAGLLRGPRGLLVQRPLVLSRRTRLGLLSRRAGLPARLARTPRAGAPLLRRTPRPGTSRLAPPLGAADSIGAPRAGGRGAGARDAGWSCRCALRADHGVDASARRQGLRLAPRATPASQQMYGIPYISSAPAPPRRAAGPRCAPPHRPGLAPLRRPGAAGDRPLRGPAVRAPAARQRAARHQRARGPDAYAPELGLGGGPAARSPAGLVERGAAPGDGRRVQASLTARGRCAPRCSPGVVQDALLETLRALAPATRAGLSRGLVELADGMGLGPAAPMSFEEQHSPRAATSSPRPAQPRCSSAAAARAAKGRSRD